MDENTQRISRNNRKPNSKDEDITNLVVFLSQRHTNGRLNKGATEEAMDHFPFKKSSIQRIWKKARPGVLDPDVVVDIEHKKKGRSGRKRKYETEDLEAMAQVPLSQQSQGTAEPVIPITATVSTVTVSVPNGCKLFSDCHSGENVNCIYCREITTAAHYCSLCLYVVHAICGTSDGEEGYGKPVKCFRCRPM
jgi:hypothetical protein